jgi:hypothetical protein
MGNKKLPANSWQNVIFKQTPSRWSNRAVYVGFIHSLPQK